MHELGFNRLHQDASGVGKTQGFDETALSDPLARSLNRIGDRIAVDEQLRTSVAGVYAGGDCTSLGQDLTVQAVQHGKLAAEAIHAQLMLNQEAA